jgi:hypothetical protein
MNTQLEFMERVKLLHYNNSITFSNTQQIEAMKIARKAQREALTDICKLIKKIHENDNK